MVVGASRAETLAAMARRISAEDFIANLATEISTIETSVGALPMTRNAGTSPTCYICCPSVAYLDYAKSELRHFSARPLVKSMLMGLIEGVRPLLVTSGLDRQVQPNNWLLATNPVPDFGVDEIVALTRALVVAHPQHAVIWRSLNEFSDGAKIEAFRMAGYAFLPARQIYLFDCRDGQPPRHRDERRDDELLERGDYHLVSPNGIDAADYARMAELYGQLYLDKYTQLNPRYGAEFIAEAHASGLIEFHGLRNGAGQLDGVVGFFDMGQVMTAPIVGYDTSLPAQSGLYRRLMALALKRARDGKLLFNMSAGAAGFKRNRGGVAALEYTAVYNRHLGTRQRMAGWLVRKILETIGIPILKRFEL